MKALILRLDAPMMSFGGVLIDRHGFIDRFPGQAMLAGLIGNALGWRHSDFERLQALQERVCYAARWDVAPQTWIDYQTVDLGQPKMSFPGWTTRGEPEHRDGGKAKMGTHQKFRHYWVDGLMTVALGLKTRGEPDLETIEHALRRPARPLFLGRKTCLPARPLLDPKAYLREGVDILDILRRTPRLDRRGLKRPFGAMEACWPAGIEYGGSAGERTVYDLREWANQLPAGGRLRCEGLIKEDS
ncbi:MAG: type I-E CRISPR-associated protein Cas5/CasD [Deltaproteobacteria bacterium]|nr:type I-E CRISPR-associated protein Cas5/CasD [Deltaproteobacteria bacterium]